MSWSRPLFEQALETAIAINALEKRNDWCLTGLRNSSIGAKAGRLIIFPRSHRASRHRASRHRADRFSA
jgi:hypothetical protein